MDVMDKIYKNINNYLCGSTREKIDLHEFKGIIQAHRFSIDQFLDDIIPVENNPYSKKVLYLSENLSVSVVQWSETRFSAIHDHAQSMGVVQVLEGTIINELYDPENAFSKTGSSIYKKGTMIDIPTGIYHKMGSAYSDKRTVTLHFYTPPIEQMKIVSLGNRFIYTLPKGSGAWFPKNEKDLKKASF